MHIIQNYALKKKCCQNCSKASVRDLCRPELCENIGKFGSLPCPLIKFFLGLTVVIKEQIM
jgi:hypothetical protein